jgi:hypothetical protein
MNTAPVSGRVSMVTTGTFLVASCSRVGAMAAVSCGAITTPLTPWLTNVCTFEIRVATSFCELVVLSSTPAAWADGGMYLM